MPENATREGVGVPRTRHITSLPRCGHPPGSKCEVRDMTHGAASPTAFSQASKNAYKEGRGDFPRGPISQYHRHYRQTNPNGLKTQQPQPSTHGCTRTTFSGNRFRGKGSGPSNGAAGRGRSSPTFTNAWMKGSITSPSQRKDSSLPTPQPGSGGGGVSNGTMGFETRPMKKMSRLHTQKWPQGGARRLTEKNLLQARGPTTTQREVTGAYPKPPVPKAQGGGESKNRNSRRRGSGEG